MRDRESCGPYSFLYYQQRPMYTQISHTRKTLPHLCSSALPSPSLSFHFTPTTFKQISSPCPLNLFQLLTEFSLSEHAGYLCLFRYHHIATPVRSKFLLTLVPNLWHTLVCFLCAPKTSPLQPIVRPNNHRLNSHVPQHFPKPNSPNRKIQCRSSVEDIYLSRVF